MTILSPAQMRVMNYLRCGAGMNTRGLSLMVWKSTTYTGVAGKVLVSLERLGLITNNGVNQKRSLIQWIVTQKGLEVFHENIKLDQLSKLNEPGDPSATSPKT